MLKRLLPFLLLIIAIPAFARDLDTRAIDRVVQETMKAWRVPGAAVAIVQDDKVVYSKGFGVKELGKPDPVTPNTLFAIASNSKAFTTAAMAILVDEKKMAWDDPVRKYVDYFHLDDPCADSLVTLRDIVSHRTGLSRHDELWDNSTLTREQVIKAIGNVKLSKPIRTAYQYNNIMFMTAGEAVATAAKMPWADFVRTRIFEPLGMTHTVMSMADFYASDHATAYEYDRKKNVVTVGPPDPDVALGPAGAIKSCANDMAQWVRFQLDNGTIDGKRIVSADALEETKEPQFVIPMGAESKANNPGTNIKTYGMGWNVEDYLGKKLVEHAGALSEFRSQVALLPDERAGVAVMININRSDAALAIRRTVIDILLNAPTRDWSNFYLTRENEAIAKAEKDKAEKEAKLPKDTKPTHDLSAYTGIYENAGYGTATVSLENGGLVLRWQKLTLPLEHWTYDTFSAVSEPDDIDEKVQFLLGPDGEIRSLTIFGEEWAKKGV